MELNTPQDYIDMIEAIYRMPEFTLRDGTDKSTSRRQRAGIRQGCPLSPMLFEVVADVLLRRLVEVMPSRRFRAFADDLGLSTNNFDQIADTLQREFEELGAISNLHLLCLFLCGRARIRLFVPTSGKRFPLGHRQNFYSWEWKLVVKGW